MQRNTPLTFTSNRNDACQYPVVQGICWPSVASIVKGEIESSEFLHGPRNECLNFRRFVTSVNWKTARPPPCRMAAIVSSPCSSAVSDHEGGACARHCQGSGTADPRSAAGYNSNLFIRLGMAITL